jgi:hypothetical protein
MRPQLPRRQLGGTRIALEHANPTPTREEQLSMTTDYVPPVQKGFGQLVDSVFLLLLVYCSLLAPLLLKAPDKPPEAQTAKTQVSWRELGQNPAMEAQWRKLGYDAEQAKPIITTRFDYQIEPGSLIVTALVIVGYFGFVLRVSDRQYRQVIAEKFGE